MNTYKRIVNREYLEPIKSGKKTMEVCFPKLQTQEDLKGMEPGDMLELSVHPNERIEAWVSLIKKTVIDILEDDFSPIVGFVKENWEKIVPHKSMPKDSQIELLLKELAKNTVKNEDGNISTYFLEIQKEISL